MKCWKPGAVILGMVMLGAACSSGAPAKGVGQSGPEGGTGQEARSFRLMSPEEGQVVTGATFMVIGELRGELTGGVEVDGVLVEVVEGRFEREIQTRGGGDQIVEVRANGEAVRRRVVVDHGGPVITLTSPARGEHLGAGPIAVSGVVSDPSGIGAVTVNGTAATVDASGAFRASVAATPGVNRITVKATDAEGQESEDIRSVISGQYAPWGQPTDDAITARVSAEALAQISDSLTGKIGPELLDGLGGGEQPAAPNPDFELLGADFRGVALQLIPQDGKLEVVVEIYGLEVDFRAVFEGQNVQGEIEADPAELRLGVVLDADGAGGLDVSLVDPQVEMHSFDFDVRGLLGLVDWVIAGIVEDKLEEGIIEALTGFILEDVITSETLAQTIDILGAQADLQLLLTGISVDPGGLDVTLDAAVNTAPGPQATQTPGSYTTPGPAPDASQADAGIQLTLADDFVNQLLGGLWRAGSLEIDLNQVIADLEAQGKRLPITFNATTMATLMGAQGLLELGEGSTTVGATISPRMPPVVVVTDDPNAPLRVDLGEAWFTFTLEKSGGAIHWATLSTHMAIEVGVDAETGELDLKIEAWADLIDEPAFDVDDATAERAIVTILKLLPGALGGDDEEVTPEDGEPVEPPQPGLTMGGLSLTSAGAQGGFLAVLIDLAVDLTPAPAPELAILHTATNPDNGHTYHLLAPSTWSDAEAAAVAMGGHLATVRSRDENEWLRDTFGRWDGENRDMWIGLHDLGHEGTFTWVSGEPVEFTRWARDPDNGADEKDTPFNEDFVHIYGDRSPRSDGRWNDCANIAQAPWNEGIHGVVEIIPDPEAPEAPEPEEGN